MFRTQGKTHKIRQIAKGGIRKEEIYGITIPKVMTDGFMGLPLKIYQSGTAILLDRAIPPEIENDS